MVREARFWCRKLLVDCKITPWFCHLTTGKLYHPAVNGCVLLESVKDKAAEGEEWTPSFQQLFPRYSGPLTPSAPVAIRLWQTITFNFSSYNRIIRVLTHDYLTLKAPNSISKFSKNVESKLYHIENSQMVDLYEVAHTEPPHQDLRFLQIQLFSSLELKELTKTACILSTRKSNYLHLQT